MDMFLKVKNSDVFNRLCTMTQIKPNNFYIKRSKFSWNNHFEFYADNEYININHPDNKDIWLYIKSIESLHKINYLRKYTNIITKEDNNMKILHPSSPCFQMPSFRELRKLSKDEIKDFIRSYREYNK